MILVYESVCVSHYHHLAVHVNYFLYLITIVYWRPDVLLHNDMYASLIVFPGVLIKLLNLLRIKLFPT